MAEKAFLCGVAGALVDLKKNLGLKIFSKVLECF